MLHEKWLCKVCLNSEVLWAVFAPDLCAYLMLPFRIGNVSKVPEIAVLIGPTINAILITHRRLKTLTTINIIIIVVVVVVVVVNITFQ